MDLQDGQTTGHAASLPGFRLRVGALVRRGTSQQCEQDAGPVFASLPLVMICAYCGLETGHGAHHASDADCIRELVLALRSLKVVIRDAEDGAFEIISTTPSAAAPQRSR